MGALTVTAILCGSSLAGQSASPQNVFRAATAAANAEDFSRAEALLLSIRQSYPNPAALEYQLALVQYHEGHIADSQATLTEMVSQGKSTGDVHNLLGWCWFKSADIAQAEREMNEAIRIDPSSVTNYLDLARMQLASRQVDASLDTVSRATQLFPASPEPWLLKGSIETAAQKQVDAVNSYTTAVRLSKHDVEAELALATAQSLAGMTARSRTSFQRLLERYPRNAQIHAAYAEFLSSTEPAETTRIAALMKTAASLDPSLAEPHYYLGNMALTAGKVQEAVRQLQLATQLDPTDSKTHFALSRALRQQGDAAASERELNTYKQLKAQE